MKIRTEYVCHECGASSPKWIGNCPSCNSWNTYQEVRVTKNSNQRFTGFIPTGDVSYPVPVDLHKIEATEALRLPLSDNELHQVLGGGLVTGSLVLLGGEPGIGKSTLLLQMVLSLSKDHGDVLYVSGEESAQQIKMRADRIGTDGARCKLLNETRMEEILNAAVQLQPIALIIDSIQTVYCEGLDSSPGTVSQIREATRLLMGYAKKTHTPVAIIGHINKEGSIAGPKVLEHMVDTVLHFEGDKHYPFRILRVFKNRFGHTDEIGIYEMKTHGLVPVPDPSGILLGQSISNLSGTAVAANIEGIRPMMVETQALVTNAVYGTPQRSATGYDLRRLNMILAVLEKRCGLFFGQHDVFLNMAGGLKILDPALDLAVSMAMISSMQDLALSAKDCFAGEVGLTGEIRRVSRVELRIKEARRLGFERIFVSSHHKDFDINTTELEIIGVDTVSNIYEMLFLK